MERNARRAKAILIAFVFSGTINSMQNPAGGHSHHIRSDTTNAVIATLRDLQSGIPITPSQVVRFADDGQLQDTAAPQVQQMHAPAQVVLQLPPAPVRHVNRWVRPVHAYNFWNENKKTVCGLFTVFAFGIAIVIWRLT